MEITAKRIKIIRERLKLSQSELARLSGVDQSCISRAESNENRLSLENLYKICKALDTTSDYLIGLIDDPEKINNN